MRNYKEHRLSKTDKIIMDFFWNTDETEIMARDVLQYAHEIGKNWNQQNVANYLKNLQKIGMIKSEVRNGKYYYYPIMTAIEYKMLSTKQVIQENFNGSYSAFMAALLPDDCSIDEISALKRMLDEYENNRNANQTSL